MSDYSKSTNFTTKDTLPTGNAGKIVKGTELDTEFTAIASAISSKADVSSPNLLGTPTAPTASAGTSTTQLATTSFVSSALSAMYPVGSIYINASVSTNPSTLLGFGTWTAFGAGKVIIGLDSSDALFDTLEETGGSKDAIAVTHTHTATSTVTDPGHNHPPQSPGSSFWGNNYNTTTGSPGGQSSPAATTTGNAVTGITVATTIANGGSSGTNANVQPYIVVKMWKRTA
jgi:hypothetical protein